MCGIAGILTSESDLDVMDGVERMKDALSHRCPDDAGTQLVEIAGGFRLGLGHTRLSILDLSSAARQPMHDEPSGSWIVYNGEIYNHRELREQGNVAAYKSSSDTETCLLYTSDAADE